MIFTDFGTCNKTALGFDQSAAISQNLPSIIKQVECVILISTYDFPVSQPRIFVQVLTS